MEMYLSLTSSIYLLDGAVVGSVNCDRITEWHTTESSLRALTSRRSPKAE